MNIKGIGKGNLQNITPATIKTEPKSNVQKDERTPIATNPTDKLDISANAQKLLNIKNKIENGFYDDESVVRQTSARIFQKYFK